MQKGAFSPVLVHKVCKPITSPLLSTLCVCLCALIFPFHDDTSLTGLGHLMTSPSSLLQISHFQIRPHPEVLGVQTSTHQLGGDTIQPTVVLLYTLLFLICMISKD